MRGTNICFVSLCTLVANARMALGTKSTTTEIVVHEPKTPPETLNPKPAVQEPPIATSRLSTVVELNLLSSQPWKLLLLT